MLLCACMNMRVVSTGWNVTIQSLDTFEDNASMIDHCVQAAYQPILLFYRKDDVDSNVGTNAFPQSGCSPLFCFP